MFVYWQYSAYDCAVKYDGDNVLLQSWYFFSPCSEIQPHPVPSLRTANQYKKFLKDRSVNGQESTHPKYDH